MAGSIVAVVRTGAQVAIPLVTFAVGLGAGSLRPAVLRTQRRLIGRSLLAALVIVPIGTVLLASVLPVASEVRAGLLTMAIAIGPAAALRRVGRGNGDADYALGLNLALLLAGLVYIPIAAKLLGALFHRDLHVTLRAVVRPVILAELVPLLAGLSVVWFAPRAAERLVKPVAIAANVVLALVVVLVLALLWRPVFRIGGGGLFAMAAAAILAIIVGHVLGGPAPRTRMFLASFCAIKFPAMAIVIATTTPLGKRVLPVIVAYVFVSSAALVVYGALRRAAKPAAATPRAAPARA
jgi:BASS family bile acid:Na+ symporter